MNTSHRLYSSSSFDQVLSSRSGTSAVLTLNRPKALNSLSLDMVRFLTPKYYEFNKDAEVSNIVLKGVGKAFCAGGDIVQIYESGLAKKFVGKEAGAMPVHATFFREEYNLNHLIGTLTTPHVAILNGIVMGGGVGLSVHGHFRIATENTLFAMPETGIGFFPDVGGSFFLPRLQGGFGPFLALTGYRLKGYETKALGIATHYIESSSLEKVEQELSKLKTKDVSQVKNILDKFSSQNPSLENSEIFQEQSLIHEIFTRENMSEIISALENSSHPFSKKILEIFSKVSPTSLAVTLKQMQYGKKMSFKECFSMEYKLTQAFMDGNDFFEGVRALLVDKTKDPKWKPATLAEVSQKDVDAYFEFPAELSLPLPLPKL